MTAIPLLGIHTKETRIERDICTPIFTLPFFYLQRGILRVGKAYCELLVVGGSLQFLGALALFSLC